MIELLFLNVEVRITSCPTILLWRRSAKYMQRRVVFCSYRIRRV